LVFLIRGNDDDGDVESVKLLVYNLFVLVVILQRGSSAIALRGAVVEVARDVHFSIHSDGFDFSRVYVDADALAFAPTPSVGFRERAPARERVFLVLGFIFI
jgi:hypothetical protein